MKAIWLQSSVISESPKPLLYLASNQWAVTSCFGGTHPNSWFTIYTNI